MLTPMWVGNNSRPVRVRLIGGDAELIFGVGIIEKMRIKGDFGKRNFHVGHREEQVVTRSGGNRWVFALPPTASGRKKLAEYLAKMENCDLDVLAVRADFGDISGAKKDPAPKKIEGEIELILLVSRKQSGRHVYNLINRIGKHFPRKRNGDQKKMWRDLGEIDALNINEECVVELKSGIAELRNSEIISDISGSGNILKAQEERKSV